jgi:hypothetical protein
MITSLVRMRLYAFWRSGRVVAPLVTTLALVGLLYGGGAQSPGDGYGFSAYVLMPVLAWQTKMLLDTEPDVARRLAIVAVGHRRELVAGLVAAVSAAMVTIVIALVLPWLFGGISLHPRPGDAPLGDGFALGPWALLLAVPPGIALGALASRVVTRSAGAGAIALVGGWICVVVAGLPRSPVRWLVPPLIGVTKAARASWRLDTVAGLTAWTLAWSLLAAAAYAYLRRTRV